jgi:hypothetical protein
MFEIFLKMDSFSWVAEGADTLPVEGAKAEADATEAAMRRAETFMVRLSK